MSARRRSNRSAAALLIGAAGFGAVAIGFGGDAPAQSLDPDRLRERVQQTLQQRASDRPANSFGPDEIACLTYASAEAVPVLELPRVARWHIHPTASIPACEKALRARPNDPRLMTALGRALRERGEQLEGFKLLRQAAAVKNPGALTALGRFEEAIALGFAPAMTAFGVVSRDLPDSAKWIRKAADLGEPGAMVLLGRSFRRPEFGVVAVHQGLSWFKKADALRDPDGSIELGRTYEAGIGVAQDYATAREWYARADELGAWYGRYRIGVHHLDGLGLAKDPAAARGHFERAAELGGIEAMLKLMAMHGAGIGGPKDPKQAQAWRKRAIEAGHRFSTGR